MINDPPRQLLEALSEAERIRATTGQGILLATGVGCLVAAVIMVLLFIFFPPVSSAYWEELDKRKLECRMLGGSWEYFGSQGWQCIPEVRIK